MKQIHLSNNQHTPKTSIANCDHDKRVEDKIKENESNSCNNSIQTIIQKPNSLKEEMNLYRNECDEPVTNISNNTNNQINNTRLDDKFSTQNELLLSPKGPSFTLPTKEPYFNNFFTNHNTSSELICKDELKNEIIPSHPEIFPEQNNNMSELIIENATNDGINIPLININNSNRNELNPQNSNANNNNFVDNSNRNRHPFIVLSPREIRRRERIERRRRERIERRRRRIERREKEMRERLIRERERRERREREIREIEISEIIVERGERERIIRERIERGRRERERRERELREIAKRIKRLREIFKRIRRERRERRKRERERERERERIKRTAFKNLKKKLTRIRFKKSVSSNGNSECCPICCEDFKYYQNLYSLPCHHLFHISCLNQEIKYRKKCPMCRKSFKYLILINKNN